MKKRMVKLCYIAALVCVVYCIGVILTKAAGTKFFLIWFMIAAGFAAVGYGIQKNIIMRLPAPVKAAGIVILCLGILVFCFVEGLILSRFGSKGEGGLSYIIVLGAQMKENGPSVALARRLDRAYDYLTENPDTLCILSGGKGSNEPVSEAQGMQEYLVKKGMDPQRLILEDQSVNTQQNLAFSRRLIPDGITKVGIVTSNFHVYRSTQLAKKQGFPDAVGIAATSGVYFLPNNMLREFFGIVKDRAFGNMYLWK
ncbi:MAG: YdcF family protein [Eubacteriales bacterium]|nr:YdcF family protein [Eubacteriales bacterium]